MKAALEPGEQAATCLTRDLQKRQMTTTSSHVGALASAATAANQRNAIWAVGGGLVLTRIVLLAHWTSDVVAGLADGAALGRLLRCVTGFERR
jgi:hypothetical protein